MLYLLDQNRRCVALAQLSTPGPDLPCLVEHRHKLLGPALPGGLAVGDELRRRCSAVEEVQLHKGEGTLLAWLGELVIPRLLATDWRVALARRNWKYCRWIVVRNYGGFKEHGG
jgi:hypothetical protein